MSRSFRGQRWVRHKTALCTTVVMIGGMLSVAQTASATPAAPTSAATPPHLIAPARAQQPVRTPGETFFTSSFDVTTQDQLVTISGSQDASSVFYADDIVQLDITHPDGSLSQYVADDSNGCTSDQVILTPPTFLGHYFQPGVNHVRATLRDACGGDDGNSDIWLTYGATGATPNHDPTFTEAPTGVVYPGRSTVFTVSATDPDGDPVTITSSLLPLAPVVVTCTGLGTAAVHASVSCTLKPSVGEDITDDIMFTASDGRGGAAVHTVTVGPAYYASLGDSYSSGEGNPPFDPGTNMPSDNCHRSSASWTRQLTYFSKFAMAPGGHIACSGAISDDLTHTNHSYKIEPAQDDRLKNLAVTPSVITLTMGGNDTDFKFAPIVAACYLFGNLPPATSQCSKMISDAESNFPALKRTLIDDYNHIHSKIPSARIVVVGYPNLMSDNSTSTAHCPWIDHHNRVGLQNLSVDLDAAINSAVSAAPSADNAAYVSTLHVLQGHELCTAKSWVNDISVSGKYTKYSAHPNQAGQLAIMQPVAAYLNKISL